VENNYRLAIINDKEAIFQIDQSVIGLCNRKNEIIDSIIQKRCLILCNSNKIIGYLIFNDNFFGRRFIELLVVHKDYQRKGYGEDILKHFENEYVENEVFTSTNQSNIPMKMVLVKMGYLESGIINNLDKDDPEIIFYKKKYWEDN
jgi:GNAT superfamily N-acetyltransferase